MQHAARNNILIARTVDLLHFVALRLAGKTAQDQVLQLLTDSRGRLRVTRESSDVVQE